MASHSETAHRWALGLDPQSDVRRDGSWPRPLKSFNVIHDGPSIYSHGYHFKIAQIVDTPCAGRAVLFTERTYSMSTSKHIREVSSAIPQSATVLYVPRLDDFDGDRASVEAACEAFVREAIAAHAKASRARTRVQWHLDTAERALGKAEALANAYGVPFERPALSDLSARAAEMAEREKAARVEAALKAAEANRLQRERDAERFAAWQAGEPVGVPYSYRETPTGGAYLRRRQDELQTSQGASVPWAHALRAFRFIKLLRSEARGFKRNGRTVRVGHYQIDRIDPNGDFQAGCHFIEWAEVERLAIHEGVFAAEPSDAAVTVTGAA